MVPAPLFYNLRSVYACLLLSLSLLIPLCLGDRDCGIHLNETSVHPHYSYLSCILFNLLLCLYHLCVGDIGYDKNAPSSGTPLSYPHIPSPDKVITSSPFSEIICSPHFYLAFSTSELVRVNTKRYVAFHQFECMKASRMLYHLFKCTVFASPLLWVGIVLSATFIVFWLLTLMYSIAPFLRIRGCSLQLTQEVIASATSRVASSSLVVFLISLSFLLVELPLQR